MTVTSSCCSARPMARAHLGESLSGSTTITPARYAAQAETRETAELLVVGDIATGNPAARSSGSARSPMSRVWSRRRPSSPSPRVS